MQIAGRTQEITLLNSLLEKRQSEFVAIYGRRRVGKTYLIRQVYQRQIVFECSGLHEKSLEQQLEIFWLTVQEYHVNGAIAPMPKTWLQAFAQLKRYLNTLKNTEKKVIFLDEIPWFETPRAGFLAALDNFWNQYCSKRTDIILVICGSAASWIINKVVNNRGGLHNRITTHIQLMPFNLRETQAFLELQQVQLIPRDVVQLYMCVGGIPFYLKDVEAGRSVPQILDRLFFTQQATLKREFSNLYASLFKNSEKHEQIVAALATKNKGLTRQEIIKMTNLASGGGLNIVLRELIECGFVQKILPLNQSRTDVLYRLMDEYSLFYFKFLANQKINSSWMQMTNKPVYKSWLGYAFENVCLKHTAQIKRALGINGIVTNNYSWLSKGNAQRAGAQIDLVIDRSDNCINLFELKFYNTEFEITQDYADRLRQKIAVFKARTQTKKNVFLTMITAFGVKRNAHYLSVVTNQLRVEELFEEVRELR